MSPPATLLEPSLSKTKMENFTSDDIIHSLVLKHLYEENKELGDLYTSKLNELKKPAKLIIPSVRIEDMVGHFLKTESHTIKLKSHKKKDRIVNQKKESPAANFTEDGKPHQVCNQGTQTCDDIGMVGHTDKVEVMMTPKIQKSVIVEGRKRKKDISQENYLIKDLKRAPQHHETWALNPIRYFLKKLKNLV